MKVKDLLKELQAMDPESEVVVGGEAIHFVEELPGYYDGHYEVLIEDPSKKPYYSVDGMKFTRADKKVKLHTLTINDIIWNCDSREEVEKIKWEFDSGLHQQQKAHIEAEINKSKEEFFNYLKGEGK